MPAIVLAAGVSRRLGEPKQLAVVAGEPLLARAVRIALEAGCKPIVVAVGNAEIAARCWPDGKQAEVDVVLNEDAASGMASSVRAGLDAVMRLSGTCGQRFAGVLVLTCDMPAVTSEHLRALLELGRSGVPVVASSYAGRRGVPAFLGSSMFPHLQALRGDEGARSLLRDAVEVELPGGELDVDTPLDLALARERYGVAFHNS